MTTDAFVHTAQRRLIRTELIILTFVVAMVALLGGLTAWIVLAQRPVFRYSLPVYLPAAGVLCPDETLSYSATTYVYRPDANPFSVHSWWSVDGGYSAVDGRGLVFSVWTDNTPAQITQAITVTVPVLPPGHYEYRVGTSAGATLGTYSVPFIVPATC